MSEHAYRQAHDIDLRDAFAEQHRRYERNTVFLWLAMIVAAGVFWFFAIYGLRAWLTGVC